MLQSIQSFTFFKLPEQHTYLGTKWKKKETQQEVSKQLHLAARPAPTQPNPTQPTSINYVYQFQDRVFFAHLITTHLSMKQQGSFVLLCHSEISQTTACFAVCSWYLWKAIRWVGLHPLGLRLFGATVWKLLIIESFFQWILNKFQTENLHWNFEVFLVLLESDRQITFNSVYFTIFKAKVWRIFTFFFIDFVTGNSNQLQKLGLEGKFSWALNVFTFSNLEIFNSENLKNKECVHTWTNSSGYT